MTDELIYRDECFKIIGACFELYNDKGCGFQEPIYQECLAIELEYQGLPFEPQCPVQMFHRGRQLTQFFKPDFICFGKIIVEIKAVSTLIDEHRAQVISYLNATGLKLGLLVNFGSYPKLEWERLAFTKNKKRPKNDFEL